MQKSKLNFRKLLGQPSAPSENAHSNPNTESRPSASQYCTFSAGAPITCVDRSPDGRRAVVAASKIFKILSIEGTSVSEDLDLRAAITSHATTHETGAATPDLFNIRAVKWSHDVMDSTIITACGNGMVTIYDLKRAGEGFQVLRIQEHARQVHKLAINPFKCNWLLTASQDGTVKSFDLRNTMLGRSGPTIPRQMFKCNADAVRDVAWSPTDGMEFACATDSGVIQKWDIRKPVAPVLKIAAHQSPCFSIAWHPDGEHLISGGTDHHCYVWNLSKSAERNQKPKYSFVTPAPVAQVAWRPPTWSNTAQARRAAQVAVTYEETNTSRSQNASVHIWDVARSALPFKELNHWDSAPTGLLWNSRDILWSVSRDGCFVQSDVAFAPRTIDRRGLSTFSISNNGEVAMFLESRQVPRHRQGSHHSLESSPNISHDSSSGPRMSVSKSDSEEDVVRSFLAPKQRPGHRRRLSARATQPLSSTPPNAMTNVDNKVMRLDDAVQITGKYQPQQTLATGLVPTPSASLMHQMLSKRYLLRLDRTLRTIQNKPVNEQLMSILEGFAKNAERVGWYRLAQTWRLLAFTLNLLLTRRAAFHRRSRLVIRDHDSKGSGKASPVRSGSQKSSKFDDAVDVVAKKVIIPTEPNTKSMITEEIESTSNVATPLVRPIHIRHVDGLDKQGIRPGEPEPEELKLPPMANQQAGHPSAKADTVRQGLDHRNSTGVEGYDYYGADEYAAEIEVGTMPKKKPLKLDMVLPTHRLPRLARHDSGESFQMFSTSGDSQVGMSSLSPPNGPRSVTSSALSMGKSNTTWENGFRDHGITVPAPPATSESSDDFTSPSKSQDNHAGHLPANGRPHTRPSPPALRLQEASADNNTSHPRPRSASNLSDDPNITHDDWLAWPEDPDFTILPIDPIVLIQRTIKYECQAGSINAPALLLLIRPYLAPSSIPDSQSLAVIRQHHSRLMQLKLFTTAALLRNLCVPLYPAVFATAQHNVNIGFFCNSCNKPLENDPLIPRSVWNCPRCEKALSGCAVCRQQELLDNMGYNSSTQTPAAQSSMWWLCPGCGHGGHTICMQAWHDGPPSLEGSAHSGGCCPLEGCLHPCLPGTWREQRAEEKKTARNRELDTSVRESVKSLGGLGSGIGRNVRRDSREVGQSRAVDGARGALTVNSLVSNNFGSSSGSIGRRASIVKILAPGEEGEQRHIV